MITLFDGVLIGLMLVSGLLAMIRGFSREVLSVASWVVAALAALYFYKSLSPFAYNYTKSISDSQTVADIAAAAGIFIIALIVVSVITMKIADFIVDSKIGPLDRTLGFVFGAVRGALLVVVGLLFFNWLVAAPKQPEWVANAKSKPMLDSLGAKLINMLPDDADATILERLRGKGSEEPAADEAPATSG